MDKKDIVALLEAICERPLDDSGAETELQALRVQAAKLLSQGEQSEYGTDLHREELTTALAIVLSGSDAELARRTLQEAASGSSAVRLDAESALAFVDAMEQSPQTAPADLVEELFAPNRAGMALHQAPERDSFARAWSRLASGLRPSARWRMAAASAMLLIAGGLSWSAYWQWPTSDSEVSAPPPRLETGVEHPVQPDVARSARATSDSERSCEFRKVSDQAASSENAAPAAQANAEPSREDDCARDHQIAEQAAAARKAAAAREAAEAAGNRAAAPADAAGSMFSDQIPPAALRSRPPAALVAPPALPPATR